MSSKTSKEEEQELDDIHPLVDRPEVGTSVAPAPPAAGQQPGASQAAHLKWVSLTLLVVQNSSLFVVTRYSRNVDPLSEEPLYLGSVVVLLVEFCKLLFCLL